MRKSYHRQLGATESVGASQLFIIGSWWRVGNFITLHHKPKESQLPHLRTGKQETGHMHMAYWKKRALSLKLTRVGHGNKSQGAELGLCIQRDVASNPSFLLKVAVALWKSQSVRVKLELKIPHLRLSLGQQFLLSTEMLWRRDKNRCKPSETWQALKKQFYCYQKKKDLTASYGEFPTQLLTLYSWLTLGQSLILSSHSDWKP